MAQTEIAHATTGTSDEKKPNAIVTPELAKADPRLSNSQPPVPPPELTENTPLQKDQKNSKPAKAVKSNDFRGDEPPPSPNRVEMFQQPAMSEARPVSRAENVSSSQEDVSLKGFVNVDGVRAVMTVGGRQAIVATGDLAGTLRVVEISPPRVVVQQGKQRWTITLQGTLPETTANDAAP